MAKARVLRRAKASKGRPFRAATAEISRAYAATRASRLGYTNQAISRLVYSEERTEDQLREAQRVIRTFIQKHTSGAIFADMGVGKTTGVLAALVRLYERQTIDSPTLLIAPTRVVQEVWRQEAQAWVFTRDLVFSAIHGALRSREAAIQKPAHVYLINFENVYWLLRKIRRWTNWPFDVLVIDESSFIKAPNTKRFRALAATAARFKRRYILTGTPRPRGAQGLWSQYYVLDQGERLGTSYGRYRSKYFEQKDYKGYKFELRKGAYSRIVSLVEDITLRLDKKDWLGDLPPLIKNVVRVRLPDKARMLYDKLEKKMFFEIGDAEVMSPSAGTLVGKCHQIANGAVYDTEHRVHLTHDAKLQALEEVLSSTDSNAIIVYWFKHDLARLRAAHPDGVVLTKGNLRQTRLRWNKRKIRKLFVNAKSAGHGLNLQFGGNVLVFFSLTYSLEAHDQVIARIGPTRQKGVHDRVYVHYLLAKDTIDEAILESNRSNAHGQDTFMNALNRYRNRRLG